MKLNRIFTYFLNSNKRNPGNPCDLQCPGVTNIGTDVLALPRFLR